MIEFEAKRLDKGVGLTCQRKDCGGKFIANPERMRTIEAAAYRSAMCCPYCARPSALPEEVQP